MGHPQMIALVVSACVLCVAYVALTYNGLLLLRNRVLNAYAQIDVQLKRRYDLIPNLVETVRAYMTHERQTLEAVVAARDAASVAAGLAGSDPADAGAIAALVTAEAALVGALARFRMLGEAYPQLKADRNAAHLFEELTATENRIAFARQAYNDAVTAYNTRVRAVPSNVVAGLFGFGRAELFAVLDPAERAAPQVAL
jgi:LemA protein